MKPFAAVRAALLVLGAASTALADPHFDLPKAIETPTPLAPPGAAIAPVFVVEAVVSRTGQVTLAKVVSGEEALAATVETAVLSWRFEPALRDGVPVAAKIRLRVELRLPPGDAAPPTDSGASKPKSAPLLAPSPVQPKTGAPAEDVVVRGTRPLAPHVELLSAEIREMPGAFGDAFRAVEALPGVTPILSGIPYFVIRGAPPGNTGFFLDGIRVPSLFHFAIGEAVIHPGIVESVSLYSGAYPANFGRFAGGILSGDVVAPSDKLHGEASVRVIDTGALIETPFASGRGDALVSGRVGYPGLLLKLFDPSVGLGYYDYQARVAYRFGDGSEVRLFGFGSYDTLSERMNGGTNGGTNSGPLQQVLGIEFERVAVRYTRRVGKKTEVRVEATVGHDRTESGNSPPVTLGSESYSLKAELTSHPEDGMTLRAGADLVFEPYRFDLSPGGSIPGGSNQGSSDSGDASGQSILGAILPTAQNDLTAGIYGDLATKLSPRVDADFGARADLFTATYPGQSSTNPATRARQVAAFDPRLTMRYRVARRVSLISALGMAHQPSNIPLPIPALSFSQLGRGLQTAYQASEGVEVKLPWEFVSTMTLFSNAFTGLAQLSNNCPSSAPPSCAATTVPGRAYGVELLVRRRLTERLSGWLSYTLSRSERDSFDGTTGTWAHQLSEFDRPQVGNLIVAYDLGAHWRAGGRFVAYSGTPYATGSLDGTPNARTPPFFRLDLRVEKRWKKKWGHIAFIAEWLNVLLRKEQLGLTCDSAGAGPCTPATIGPITIPSLGLEAAF